MLTREQAQSLRAGDILDVKIIDSSAPRGNKVIDELAGRIVRVVVEHIRVQLLPNSQLIKVGTHAPDPIGRVLCCQALSGDNLPGHIVRILPPADQSGNTAKLGLFDWMIEDFHVVSGG